VNRPDGSVARYSYDGGGRMSAISVSQGAVTDTMSYSYSPTTGSVGAISASNGVNLGFTYDGSLLTGTTWSGPVAGSVTYGYNNDFALTSLGVDGSTVSFAYDPDGLLTQAGALALTYSPRNLLVTGSTLGNLSDSWGYDGFGAPITYTVGYNESGGPTSLYAASYGYDALGRVITQTETLEGTPVTTTYQYDGDGRLTSVATNGTPTASYIYDANGNRLTATDASNVMTSGTYNARDELTAYGATRYAYSPTGDLLTKSTGALTTTYAYDGFDHLQSVTLPNGMVISYLIDGLGRRVGKLVNGTLTQGFLYQSGWRPVAELDGSGKVISRFVYGPRLTAPEYFVQGGVTYRIITDRRGSVRLVVNAATGEVAEQIDYDPFGNVLKDTNPGFQPFGFAGGLYDSDTGLVHFGAREYDPTVGRWTTPDPQLFAGGDTNLYTYVRNDPVNLVDPTGSNGAAGGAEGWFMDTLTDAVTEVGSGAARSGPENQIKQNLESLGADPEYAEAIASMLNDGISGAAGGAVTGSEFGPGGSLLGAGIGTIVNTTISALKSDVHAFNELMKILHENEERDRMNREMKQRLLDRQSGLCGPGAPSPAPFSGSPSPYENPAMTSNPNYSGQQTPLPYGFYGSE
jgi:RHS repeat-associated protein